MPLSEQTKTKIIKNVESLDRACNFQGCVVMGTSVIEQDVEHAIYIHAPFNLLVIMCQALLHIPDFAQALQIASMENGVMMNYDSNVVKH